MYYIVASNISSILISPKNSTALRDKQPPLQIGQSQDKNFPICWTIIKMNEIQIKYFEKQYTLKRNKPDTLIRVLGKHDPKPKNLILIS